MARTSSIQNTGEIAGLIQATGKEVALIREDKEAYFLAMPKLGNE